MKICYLMSSFEGGGASATLPALLGLLKERGHEVEIVACEARDMKIVAQIAKAGMPWKILRGGTLGKPFKTILFALHVRKTKPDLIWTSHSKAAFVGQVVGKLLKCPVVSWKNLVTTRAYLRWTGRKTQLWLADSKAVVHALETDLNVPPKEIQLWPLFECADRPLPTRLPVTPNRPLHVGSLGRLHTMKQYPLLIAAVAALKRAHPDLAKRLKVTIAGDGPEEAALKALTAQLEIEDVVRFAGFLPDVTPFLETLDVYVQPSESEGLCLGVHEAMNSGLPVIATPVGDLRTVVGTGETGILLQHASGENCIKDCSEALLFFLDHPEKCAPYGRHARARVQALYGPGTFRKNGLAVIERIEESVRESQTKR